MHITTRGRAKGIVIWFLLGCFLLVSTGCDMKKKTENSRSQITVDREIKDKQQHEFLGYLDTLTVVIAKNITEAKFQELCQTLEVELKRYDQLFNSFKEYPGSNNIWRINQQPVGEPLTIEQDVYDLLLRAKELEEQAPFANRLSVTSGYLLDLWQEYRTQKQTPDVQALKDAAKKSGWQFELKKKDGKCTITRLADIRLETGAVAKGFAMHLIADKLEQKGYSNVLLSVGGDVVPVGKSSDKWRVAIQNPLQSIKGDELAQKLLQKHASKDAYADLAKKDFLEIQTVEQEAVVTSGIYERYYLQGNEWYHHIIDLQTLYPAKNYLSLTVTGSDIVLCDFLSTYCFNLTLDEIKELSKIYPDYRIMVVDRTLKQSEFGGKKHG